MGKCLVIYLCIYHLLIILFLWSYYRTMFEKAVEPTREVSDEFFSLVEFLETKIRLNNQFYIGDVEGERIALSQTIEERRTGLIRLARQANLPLLTRHFDGSKHFTEDIFFRNGKTSFSTGVRYCFVCQCIKPDRAHHCSVCEKCVLRYDHHCPW